MPRRTPFAPLLLLIALALPAPAGAAGVLDSQISAPAGPLAPLVDLDLPVDHPSRSLTVSGLATAPDGTDLDIRCAWREPDGTLTDASLRPAVPVTLGAFTASIPLPGRRACMLAAVEDGSGVTDPVAFRGPRYFGAEQATSTVGGGPGPGAVADFAYGSARATLDAAFHSVAGGGAPSAMTPLDDSGDVPRRSERLWSGNAALNAQSAKAGETRSAIQVDGVNAFAPNAAATLYPGAATAAGLPSVAIGAVTRDPATGDVTHVSTEPLVTCPTTGGANVTAGDADTGTCGEFRPSGVALTRTVVLRHATRSIETKDRWVSTDGRPHDLDALYLQHQDAGGYRFPWIDGTTFGAHAAGDEISPPPGRVGSIFARHTPASPDEDPRYPHGSLTFSTRPDVIRFTGPGTFELGYRRTVPATGALGIEQRFTVGTARATVEGLAATMEARAAAGLAVAITSSTRVSGYDPSYRVGGTTSTPGGVRSLVVNGQPVTPNPDGTWSASLRLAPGANALSATVTDHAGDSASATGGVTFVPGPAQSSILTGAVTRGVLGVRIRCQTVPGTTCNGKLRLTARVTRVKRTKRGRRRSTKTVTLAMRSFSLPAGDGAAPTVRLGRSTRALVRKYRIRRGTLTLTQTVGTVAKTTRSSIPVRL